jgi:hypothetical protein
MAILRIAKASITVPQFIIELWQSGGKSDCGLSNLHLLVVLIAMG